MLYLIAFHIVPCQQIHVNDNNQPCLTGATQNVCLPFPTRDPGVLQKWRPHHLGGQWRINKTCSGWWSVKLMSPAGNLIWTTTVFIGSLISPKASLSSWRFGKFFLAKLTCVLLYLASNQIAKIQLLGNFTMSCSPAGNKKSKPYESCLDKKNGWNIWVSHYERA